MTIQSNLTAGTIVGRFGVGVADGSDEDLDPDIIPASGQVTFTPTVSRLPNPTAVPAPVTVLRVPVTAIIDAEGYLCAPDPADPSKPGPRGIRLFATDDENGSVTNWTYRVAYTFGRVNGMVPQIEAHDVAVPSGATVDLTTVAPVPSSQGYGLAQAEAAAIRAEGHATRASAIAESILPEARKAKEAAAAARNDAEAFRNQTEQAVTADLEWSGTVDVPADAPRMLHATLTGDVVLNLPNLADTRAFTVSLVLTQDATGGRQVLIWNGRTANSSAFSHTGAAGSTDVLHLLWTGQWWLVATAAQNVGAA